MPERTYDFAGKTVLIMGLGRFGGGADATIYAVKAGAKVIVTDLASRQQLNKSIENLKKYPGIEYRLGSHEPADFEKADIVITNPAVPRDNKFLEIARRANKLVTFQINIFFELCPAQIIGITGANGKSTTTALTAHLLRNQKSEVRRQKTENTRYTIHKTQYENVWLSGNIGNQPLLTILDKIKPNDLVVLELSSFQIEQLAENHKAPEIALLTNLTPNHLDRYHTFENYCNAKEKIFKYQKLKKERPAVSIFNAEDKIAAEWFEKYKNESGRTCLKFSTNYVSEKIRSVFPLPGRANLSNLAAALAIVRRFGVNDASIINSLPRFKALPHRLELVKEINGVKWYNDSKATTPDGAITALEAFEEPVIIIAGGYDKNLPFNEFGRRIVEKAKAAILIGQTAPKIAEAIKEHKSKRAKEHKSTRAQEHKSISVKTGATSHKSQVTRTEIVKSLSDAVNLANELAETGDIILLSPACASYDMFENYEQRGNEFTKLVKSLEK
jgi:UDP-N-acetylmuramoylalanine--D-glutamate ligase